MKEHRDACSRGQMEKSAVAEHAWKFDHLSNGGMPQYILDYVKRHELLLKQALHNQSAAKGSTFNKGGGVELYECWVATIIKCEKRSHQGQGNHPSGGTS